MKQMSHTFPNKSLKQFLKVIFKRRTFHIFPVIFLFFVIFKYQLLFQAPQSKMPKFFFNIFLSWNGSEKIVFEHRLPEWNCYHLNTSNDKCNPIYRCIQNNGCNWIGIFVFLVEKWWNIHLIGLTLKFMHVPYDAHHLHG